MSDRPNCNLNLAPDVPVVTPQVQVSPVAHVYWNERSPAGTFTNAVTPTPRGAPTPNHRVTGFSRADPGSPRCTVEEFTDAVLGPLLPGLR